MGIISNDGKYEIYIIQYRYKDMPDKKWIYCNHCTYWIPKIITELHYEKLKNGLFRPFSSDGDCYKKTGIYGSFRKREAIRIMDRISEWNPDHRFRLCKVFINQKIVPITDRKYEKQTYDNSVGC